MPDAIDDPSSPLDDTPGVYSSLDAPPPPFQIRAVRSVAGDKPVHMSAVRSVNRPPPVDEPSLDKRRRANVRPASVRMEIQEPSPPSVHANASPEQDVRPEQLPDGATNPGAVLAVVISLVVSMFVFVFAV